MKILKNTNVMLILLITVAISIYGFSKPGNEKVRKGSIGDVKYSILKPAEFIKENGKGWILMDGRQITKSNLYKKYGYEKAFDARGVFIRGMNLDRNDDFSDPDGNRHIGSQQDDATRLSNINSITDNADVFTIAYADRAFGGNGTGANSISILDNADWSARLGTGDGSWTENGIRFKKSAKSHSHEIKGGDIETRPKNITLYVYLKIND